uniref:Na_H_Exchanger domain-containing protein n=1 Tax=Anisakis simplex TaxID=6269 RepID=A0A0M3KDE1_ANISI
LIVMLIGSIVFGYLVDLCRLPPLLGMLIAGIVFRNAGFVDLFVVKRWGSFLRKAAFVVILLRGGLGLDANALRKLKGACVWLAVMPCTIEAIFVAISAYFLLDLPWIFGLLLGFVLAAVSPAVIVPAMLHITSKNYGVASGVPTLVIAAASVDDVYAITGFSALLSVAFSKGSVLRTIISAPIEVVAGGIFGVLIGNKQLVSKIIFVSTFGLGFLMWYIPEKSSKNVHFARLAVLGQLALLALFGCETLGFDSTGPIAILVGAFVAATQWKKEYSSDVEQVLTVFLLC